MTTRAALLDTLLKSRAPEELSPEDLAGKAHWRLDRDQFIEAHVLFEAAAERAVALGQESRSSRNRAATTLFDAGEIEEGTTRIREMLEHYRTHPDDELDRHWVEHGTFRLLRHAYETDRASFSERARALLAEAEALQGRPCPWIHPFQEAVVEWAHEVGDRGLVRALVERMQSRRPMPRKLAARLRALREWAG